MLDVVAIVSLALLFLVTAMYVGACDRLKGKRS